MEYVSTRAEGPLGAPLCMVIVVIWLDVPEIMLVTIWEMNWCDRPGLLEGHGIRKFQALYSSIFFHSHAKHSSIICRLYGSFEEALTILNDRSQPWKFQNQLIS